MSMVVDALSGIGNSAVEIVEFSTWNNREVDKKEPEETKISSDIVEKSGASNFRNCGVGRSIEGVSKMEGHSVREKAATSLFNKANGIKSLDNSYPGGNNGGASGRVEATIRWGGDEGPKVSGTVGGEIHDKFGNKAGGNYTYTPSDKDPNSITVHGEAKTEFGEKR